MYEKYLSIEMFTSPSVIISLPCSSSTRINHLGTVNVEHKVLGHLFSHSFPFKFFQQAAWPYSPSSSGDPRTDSVCMFYFISALSGDEKRKEHFNNLQ